MIKKIILFFVSVFLIMNVIAWFHASKFTEFNSSVKIKTKDANHLSAGEKLKALFFGITNPRPENTQLPAQPFEVIHLQSNKKIECWFIKTKQAKGTVVLCHGYSGHKSSMLDKAELFLKWGYSVFLIDFMGSGGSEGNQTTIGFYEADEVKTAYDYLSAKGEKNSVLFGTSMGAVAIMKAVNDYKLNPKAVIIECPFGTMLETVQARFKTLHVPAFPMANLLVFWGGIKNDFNAFEHNPAKYAKGMQCPVLLLYGEKDEKVSASEIDQIFKNLAGKKELRIYPLAGHENYLHKYKKEWSADVSKFLESTGL